MDKLKFKILILGIIIAFLLYKSKNDYNYNTSYEILEDSDAFAKVNDKSIYIGDFSYLAKLDNLDNDSVIIEDLRFGDDPNITIINSYKIQDKDEINDILEVLCYYEKCNPSNWNRSIESMRLEWKIHNIAYNLKYKESEAADVDLNNNDEEKYNNKILRKILNL